jgi:hypothetical protein
LDGGAKVNLATETAALVAAFLSGVAEGAGVATMDKLIELYQRVKGAFRGHRSAEQALERLAAKPDDEHLRAQVAKALEELIEADPSLAAGLAELVTGARSAGTETVISGSGAVAQRDLSMEGEYVAGRDLHMGERSRGADDDGRHRP